MPFVITATSPSGGQSFPVATAQEVVEKYLELQNAGYQKIVIKDDLKRTIKTDEIAQLASLQKNAQRP